MIWYSFKQKEKREKISGYKTPPPTEQFFKKKNHFFQNGSMWQMYSVTSDV